MALSNFMFKGSYLKIIRLTYSKNEKYVNGSLHILADPNSQSFVMREVVLHGNRKILGIRIANTPPKNPKHEEAFLLKGDLQDVWKNYPDHIASWDKMRNDWNYWVAYSWPEPLYLEDEKKYVSLKEGALTVCPCYDDYRIWDKFYAPDILDKSNHSKQFYLFLKSLDEFKDCEDI